jgi:hypothetical protein
LTQARKLANCLNLLDHTLGFVTALEQMLDGLHHQETLAGDQAHDGGAQPLQPPPLRAARADANAHRPH